MKTFYTKHVTIEELQLYLTNGIRMMPALYEHYLDCLDELERRGHISLVPSAIFERYHRKFKKAA